MTDISMSLTKHVIICITNSRQYAETLLNLFPPDKYKALVSLSIYDALHLIVQEMPHLILCELTLNDGSVNDLADRLIQHEILNRIPIMIIVPSFSRSDLRRFFKKRYAGIFVKSLNHSGLLGKINEVLRVYNLVSPFYYNVLDTVIDQDVNIVVSASIIGKTATQIILMSQNEICQNRRVKCEFEFDKSRTFTFDFCTNLRSNGIILNFFPIYDVKENINSFFKILPFDQEKLNRSILLFGTDQKDLHDLAKILESFDMNVLSVNSYEDCTAFLKDRYSEISCVYWNDYDEDKYKLDMQLLYLKIPVKERPFFIASTSLSDYSYQPELTIIKKPFGFGYLLNMLESSFEHVYAKGISDTHQLTNRYDVKMLSRAKLIGLDESGGLIQLEYFIPIGSSLQIDNTFLKSMGVESVTITLVKPIKNVNNKWLARFDVSQIHSSKIKYWQNLSSMIKPFLKL